MILNSQRMQRVIPIHSPPANTSVEFIKTLAALFYKKKDHGSAASKIATYHLSRFRRRFYRAPEFTDDYYQFLSAKTGVEKGIVIKTFDQINSLQRGAAFTQEQLKTFYHDLKLLTK